MQRNEKTVGEMAEKFGRPVHAVQHVVRTRGIEPCSRVGVFRLFDSAAQERIAAELRRIDAVRGK